MSENEPRHSVNFERVEITETGGLPPQLIKEFSAYPVFAPGNWQEDKLSFQLRWEGGYYNHLEPDIREEIRKSYLGSGIPWHWKKATGVRKDRLLALKELPTLGERKSGRKKIMPFPGVVMTFEGLDIKDGKVTINTRVGNYAEIHPDFGMSSANFLSLFPDHEQDLRRAARGMGVQIITETSDGYHIFGQRAANVMGAGFIGTLGITPNIYDEQMKDFIRQSAGEKALDIPASWLFDSIREDISEPDELNLEKHGLQESGFESISFIGAIIEKKDGWMHLVIFCKLTISSSEVKNIWSPADNETKNIIFVRNNPQSLTSIFSRNIYPALYGGYHAYFESFYPDMLK